MSRKVLRREHLPEATGLSWRTIQRLEAEGDFPAHIQLSARAIGWRADEVDAWLAKRADQREAA
jgi:prophage regulatory protein